MVCKRCGSEITDHSTVCGNCNRVAADIPNYLWQSIIVTLLCCLPLGIPAIIYATKVHTKLLQGDVAGALRMNLLLAVVAPFVAALLLRPSIGRRRAAPWVVLAVVAAYWVLRNIPHYPFTLLAPHP